MAETIYMRIGEQDRVDFNDFVGVLTNFLGLLKDVDSTIAQRKGGNLSWRVTQLNRDPLPLIGVTPYIRRALDDISSFVEREVVRNMATLTMRGERNKFLSDAALGRVERLAQTTSRIGSSVIYIETQREASLSTTITQQTLSYVQDLTDVKSRSFGTVTGELGSISIRRGDEFRVWDEDSNLPVRCNFTRRDEGKIKDLLRHRVMVTGLVSSNRYGLPLSINVESVDLAELGDLPTIEEMAGLVPDFTGGLSLRQFFEEID
jgi:hypothetical protein